MEIPFYMAMTPDEIQKSRSLPDHLAWMSAHFCPNSEMLCTLPKELPKESILIIDDAVPFSGQNAHSIMMQMEEAMEKFEPVGIILDFQKPYESKLKKFAHEASVRFPNKIAVTPQYDNKEAIVFLPPIPSNIPLQEYLEPWKNRVIWLDISMSSHIMQIKRDCVITTEINETGECSFEAKDLCSHYSIAITDDEIRIHLHRTQNDCIKLLQKAAEFGVTKGIGLYQEFKNQNH